MFQFRRFPTYTYLIQYTLTGLHQPGCPIRKSPDIAPAYGSPRLIAVNHVLHRLPVPRHPPCALCSLTFLCDPLNDFLSYSLVENVINYPFLVKKYCDFSRRSSQYPISRLSCITLFSFQGAIFWITWIQISILKLSLKYWNLISVNSYWKCFFF